MADILIADGTAIVYADLTDYSDVGLGARTTQLDLTSLAASGGMRQGVKVDLGATRARQYAVFAALEWGTAPTAEGLVNFFWSKSPNATAGTANAGGASGTDAAFTGDILQLLPIGALSAVASGAGTVQFQFIGNLFIPMRYGQVIVRNDSDQDLDTDATNMAVAFYPLKDQSQ